MNNNGMLKPIVEVVAMALYCKSDKSFFLARRGPNESGAGQWEFPGGKIEKNETPEQALQREIAEELSFDIKGKNIKYIATELLDLPDKTISIQLYQIEITAPKPNFSLVDHDEMGWFDIGQIKHLNISKADLGFISQLNFY
jgi:8-oxo-dGTP diphosphatase